MCGILPKVCFGTIWLDRLVGGFLLSIACVQAGEENLSRIEALASLPQEEIENVDGIGLFRGIRIIRLKHGLRWQAYNIRLS